MMITHYLKVAFRNLWKYKTQHLIALAGVGVALLCFSICLYMGHRTKRFFQWSGKMGERL